MNYELKQKLSMFCNVPVNAVIECSDVDTSIYELPLLLHRENLDSLVCKLLHLDNTTINVDSWQEVVRRLKYPSSRVTIGMVGKYVDLQDSYLSVVESITHGGIANDCGVNIVRIDAEDLEDDNGLEKIKGLQGILVPGGFGDRGTKGKILAAQFARENGIPYFGLCLGMQIAVIEFSRNVLKLEGANSAEFDPKTPHPVIHLMEEQKEVTTKGATMRLGAYPCKLAKGTHSAKAYKEDIVQERHRHRFEYNNAYRKQLEDAGLKVAGINPDKDLVEIVEVKDHPWFVGVQFHPEFKSKPHAAHPLFRDFVKAALEYRNNKRG
jgi:CTP synthase